MKLIDKSALVAEIEKRIKETESMQPKFDQFWAGQISAFKGILKILDTFEVKEVGLYNNGWIDCTKQMPQETKQTSDTLQGHKEWTESDLVLAWDSMYGCRVDATRNGKWMSECKGGCTGQIVHGIIAWRPIPEFNEELLLREQKGE